MKYYFLIVTLVALYSCGGSERTEEDILEDIQQVEDSLTEMTAGQNLDTKLYKESQDRYIANLIALYQKFPKSKKAPECVDKVHMVYSGIGDYVKATQWADTLINNYPKYINRALVLESQASTFDALIQPRDSSKVRLYYSMLLNEFPNLDNEKREGIKRRLEFNKLNFDQYIELQMLEVQDFD